LNTSHFKEELAMQVLLDSNNVIIEVGNIQTLEDGYLVNNTKYPFVLGLTMEETEEEVEPQVNKLVNGVKEDNISYIETEKIKIYDDLLQKEYITQDQYNNLMEVL